MKKIFFLLAVLLSLKGSAQFCMTQSYATSYGAPFGICNADLNGDGFKDLAIADGTVRILSGGGAGTFTLSNTLSAGANPEGIISADFNGDDIADLATSNFNSNNVSIILGTGLGNFGPAVNFNTAGSPKDLTAADLDNDGNLDLAVANSGGNSVSILLGDGSGGFSASVSYTTNGTAPYGVCAADFNGDGNKDLVVANNSSNNMSLLLGNGDGTFQSATTFGGGVSAPFCSVLCDLNQDGFSDVAVASNGGGAISVLYGTGSGGFTFSNYTVGGQPRFVCVADFNGDGYPDLAAPNFAQNNINFLAGPGFSAVSNINVPSASGLRWITTGDWNNDGKADLATTANTNGAINAFLNTLPFLNLNGTSAICQGSSTILIGSGAQTYTWNPGSVASNTISVAPTSQTTYTLSGENSACGIIPTKTITVSVNPLPFPTVLLNGPNPICPGDTTGLKVVADPGTTNLWMPGSLTTTVIVVTPAVSTTYTLVETFTATGCSRTDNSIGIVVKTAPSLTVSATATAVCAGSPVTLTATGANTYTWTGGVSNGIAFSPTTTTTYTVTGTGSNSCKASASKSITAYPLPTVNANATATLVCAGTPITLTGSGTANTYTWTGGVTDGVVFPAVLQTYTVTGVDANNCTNMATISINAPALAAPNICMLTADSLALNNIVYWDNSLYPTADSFIVYRYDAFSNAYLVIGAVPQDSSRFTDTQRNIGGPNGGDPQYSSWQYKLAIKDTCGNLSAKSPYHQSIFIQENLQNFSWNAYTIEAGQTNPVTGYSFLRDDNNVGSWHVLINTGGLSATDPNYLTYPNGNWRVDALGFSCTANFRVINGVQTTVVRSKSNISNNRTTGMRGDLRRLVSLYPNPSNGNTKLGFKQNIPGKITVEIFSALGTRVFSQTVSDPAGEVEIDLTPYEKGMYYVRVIVASQTATLPVIKN